jgi:hypothetical protein
MEWPEDLAGALPARRDDEPPELRRRILAEVRDHLQTSFQRELFRSGDEVVARHNVLQRFGDPARLARKLWFDAMWEKIMLQRGMLVAMVVLVIVSFGSTGLAWYMMLQAGQMNQALLEQNRAVNERLLARMESLASRVPASTASSSEWGALKIRVTLNSGDGAPAAGVKIQILGQAYTAGSSTQVDRTSGPNGVADFGLIRPGNTCSTRRPPLA